MENNFITIDQVKNKLFRFVDFFAFEDSINNFDVCIYIEFFNTDKQCCTLYLKNYKGIDINMKFFNPLGDSLKDCIEHINNILNNVVK